MDFICKTMELASKHQDSISNFVELRFINDKFLLLYNSNSCVRILMETSTVECVYRPTCIGKTTCDYIEDPLRDPSHRFNIKPQRNMDVLIPERSEMFAPFNH